MAEGKKEKIGTFNTLDIWPLKEYKSTNVLRYGTDRSTDCDITAVCVLNIRQTQSPGDDRYGHHQGESFRAALIFLDAFQMVTEFLFRHHGKACFLHLSHEASFMPFGGIGGMLVFPAAASPQWDSHLNPVILSGIDECQNPLYQLVFHFSSSVK